VRGRLAGPSAVALALILFGCGPQSTSSTSDSSAAKSRLSSAIAAIGAVPFRARFTQSQAEDTGAVTPEDAKRFASLGSQFSFSGSEDAEGLRRTLVQVTSDRHAAAVTIVHYDGQAFIQHDGGPMKAIPAAIQSDAEYPPDIQRYVSHLQNVTVTSGLGADSGALVYHGTLDGSFLPKGTSTSLQFVLRTSAVTVVVDPSSGRPRSFRTHVTTALDTSPLGATHHGSVIVDQAATVDFSDYGIAVTVPAPTSSSTAGPTDLAVLFGFKP
jgi:hypothetical protein